MWQTATLACPQIAMMMAWAINMTITYCGPQQRRKHHAGEHAHAQEGEGEGRAHAREGGDAVSANTGADASADAHAVREADASTMRIVDVCLLPKQQSPQEFKLLRPITILPTCIKIESRAMHSSSRTTQAEEKP